MTDLQRLCFYALEDMTLKKLNDKFFDGAGIGYTKRLIPCAGGSVKGRIGGRITHAKIYSIGLTSHKNSDARIKPLKDQT
jgi:hypothetical protein